MKAEIFYRTIVTKYIGPTTHKGGRIRVSWGDSSNGSRIFNWKSELNSDQNHIRAAKEFYLSVRERDQSEIENIRLEGGWMKTGGCFVIRFQDYQQGKLIKAAQQAVNLLGPIQAGERNGAAMGMASSARDLLAEALAQ